MSIERQRPKQKSSPYFSSPLSPFSPHPSYSLIKQKYYLSKPKTIPPKTWQKLNDHKGNDNEIQKTSSHLPFS